MKRFLTLLCRWLYLVLIICGGVYFSLRFIQHSTWYKNRVYHRLLTGTPQQQMQAAAALAYLGGQEQLLSALKSDAPSVREFSRRALEHLWFTSAGAEAYQLMESAYQAAEKEQFQKALSMLDRLVQKYPKYAEGWNRRASVYWQMGQCDKSIADSEMTLALNPNHYGAWQGIGVCRLQAGDVAEACRCLRAALKILPYDQATRDALQRCEELLRTYPQPAKQTKAIDLI